ATRRRISEGRTGRPRCRPVTMTITADEFERSDRGGIVRWTVSLLIILALHTGIFLIITLRQLSTEPIGMLPAAVMIPLAPPPPPPAITPPPPPPPPPAPHPPPPRATGGAAPVTRT